MRHARTSVITHEQRDTHVGTRHQPPTIARASAKPRTFQVLGLASSLMWYTSISPSITPSSLGWGTPPVPITRCLRTRP